METISFFSRHVYLIAYLLAISLNNRPVDLPRPLGFGRLMFGDDLTD